MSPNLSKRVIKVKTQFTLESKRLVLRAFQLEDAKDIQRLAGHPEIAATTEHIPHPYPNGYALSWIRNVNYSFNQGLQMIYAVTLKSTSELIGSIGLDLYKEHACGSMGYWIGRPYWNQGYATEAGKRLIQFGMEILGLNRIQAKHLLRNPASGKVLLKIGMLYEGTERESRRIRGVFETLLSYAILKSDYNKLYSLNLK